MVTIDSVSVAALINVKYEIDGNENEDVTPKESPIRGKYLKKKIDRSEDEISKIRALIQAAAGGSLANVVVNEIEFDDVNEKIADLEIAKMEEIENGWGFEAK
ncbi:hypothetical protein CM15mP99_2430 [bacterium]|nr:MAG: hypothetical protein CM15mP99_2430 [bacterium]